MATVNTPPHPLPSNTPTSNAPPSGPDSSAPHTPATDSQTPAPELPAPLRRLLKIPSAARFVACLVAGALAALAAFLLLGPQIAIAAGWTTVCVTYLAWVWATVLPLNAQLTREVARWEDGTRGGSEVAVVLASIASLAGVVITIIAGHEASGVWKIVLPISALVMIVASWLVVHTVYMLRYADQFYSEPEGGIDFNTADNADDGPPTYLDFAYVSIAVGTTYAITDTNVTMRDMRMEVLAHTFISYLFGVGLIGVMINVVAGLA